MAQVHHFWKLTGHPKGWHGHVVDHALPFCFGKAAVDSIWNYQWQVEDSSRIKDVYEVDLCREKITFTQYEFIILQQHLVVDSVWKNAKAHYFRVPSPDTSHALQKRT